MGFNNLTVESVLAVMKANGLEAESAPAIINFLKDYGYMKDQLPDGGVRPRTGYLYENGPFSMLPGEITSMVLDQPSQLAQWIPTSRVTHRMERVKHLEFVVPEGFDGSETYGDYLAGITLEECDFGPATDWSGFEYEMSGGHFSFSSNNMQIIPDGGAHYYEQQPLHTIDGQQISSDREWAVARILMVMSQHLNWLLYFGNRMNSDMEWDGLDEVISLNYVANRKVGSGTPHFTDPVVINGATITTAAGLAVAIRELVRRIRNRLALFNKQVAPEDIALVMPAVMWDNIAEAYASGAQYTYTPGGSGFTATGNTFSDFFERYMAIRNSRQLDVDGQSVQIIADPFIGINATIDPGGTPQSAIGGPVMCLVRRAGADLLLEQQYLDYSQFNYPDNGFDQTAPLQGGVVRTGWLIQNNTCFKYYAEMAGRLVTRGNMFQGRIDNVLVPTLMDNENESGTFTSPDFAMFGLGNQGGRGTAFLNPHT